MTSVAHCFRSLPALLRGLFFFSLSFWSVFALVACQAWKPQRGGDNSMTLGGGSNPTVITTKAPDNSKTPSTTTVEKTTVREYTQTAPTTVATHQISAGARSSADKSGTAASAVADSVPPALVRETVTERASTQLGSSWEDKARELGVKLSNMRGVMWAGVVLLILGPIVGFKMGWFTNGMIAGGVGLLLIILAQVVPGNEAWFGLGGLLLIPLVAFVWYHGHHTATAELTAPPKPTPT